MSLLAPCVYAGQMTTAVIYTRVSRDRTGEHQSVTNQEAECRRECERHGWTVLQVVSDNSVSASKYATKQRDGYLSLSSILEPGMVLVIWEMSRIGRKMEDHLALRALCIDRGVKLHYGNKDVDFEDYNEKFTAGLEALIAERSSDETRSRILLDQKYRAERGQPHSALGFGFRTEFDTMTGKRVWVHDPDTAPLIRRAAEEIITGRTLYSIVKEWNDAGVTTAKGNLWQPRTLKQLLLRPALAGLRQHQGRILDVETMWEPIITQDQFRALTAILTDPKRATQRGAERKHLLTGIATCFKCGQVVRWASFPASAHKKPQYRCPLGHVQRREDLTDKRVKEALFDLIKDRQADDFLMDETGAADGEGSPVHVHLEEAKRLKEEIATAKEKWLSGEWPQDVWAETAAVNLPRIAEQERKAAESQFNPLLARLAAGPQLEWDDSDLETRRAMIKAAFTIVLLPLPRGSSTREWYPELIEIKRR